MDSAEVYMALLRPSMVPVFGEASPLEFTGQIDIAEWTWNLKNEEEIRRAAKQAEKYDEARKFIESRGGANTRAQIQKMSYGKRLREISADYAKQLASIDAEERKLPATATKAEREALQKRRAEAFTAFDKSSKTSWEDNERAMYNLFNQQQRTAPDRGTPGDRAAADLEKQAERQDQEFNRGFEFSFSKRVDVATTQMLNSMKAGDVFPTAVLTVHQRSANAGMSLVITVQKLRLTDYALKCETSDTMTDMREEWTADFQSLAYVYKNRKSINAGSGIGQAVAKAATQGTVRAFAMKNIGLPI